MSRNPMPLAPPPAACPARLAIDEAEIDAVLDEAGGDARLAIAILLHDLAALALDADCAASRGYLRGLFSAGARAPDGDEAA